MTNRCEKDCLTADATLVAPTVTVMISGHCEATVAYALSSVYGPAAPLSTAIL